MKEFIKSLFSDVNGSMSSKRVVMFSLVYTFISLVVYNTLTGKTPSAVFTDQLFYLVIYALASVFGEGIVSFFSRKKDGGA